MNITVAVGEKKDHFSAKNKYIKSFCAQFFSKSEQKVRFENDSLDEPKNMKNTLRRKMVENPKW